MDRSVSLPHLLYRQISEPNSALCAGIDPDPQALSIHGIDITNRQALLRWLHSVISAVQPYVSAYKLQKAFFDLLPDGHHFLRECIAQIHDGGQLAILDAKVGDTENTMHAYWQFVDSIKADVLVLNPYMGSVVWRGMGGVGRPVAGAVLVRTSNHEASQIQDLTDNAGMPVWRHVLNAMLTAEEADNLFPIFSHEDPLVLAAFREALPPCLPVLFAGYGKQGRGKNALRALRDEAGGGILANSSRGLLFDRNPSEDWPSESVALRAKEQRDLLRTILRGSDA